MQFKDAEQICEVLDLNNRPDLHTLDLLISP